MLVRETSREGDLSRSGLKPLPQCTEIPSLTSPLETNLTSIQCFKIPFSLLFFDNVAKEMIRSVHRISPAIFPLTYKGGRGASWSEHSCQKAGWEGRKEGGGDALFAWDVSLSSPIPSSSLFQALSARLFAFSGSAIRQQGSPTECLQKRQKAPGYQSVLEEPTT